MIHRHWPRTCTPIVSTAARLGGVILNLLLATMAAADPAENKADPEPIIQMPPYVIQGDRVLPPPESWYYIMVPAGELTRGNKVTVVPGYEVLSNLIEANTKLLITQIQYRQLAGTILWPSVVQILPRQPMIVIVDRNKQADLNPDANSGIAWEAEPIAPFESNSDGFDSSLDMNANDPNNPNQNTGPGSGLGTRINLGGSKSSEPAARTHFTPLPRGYVRITAREGIVTATISADSPRANGVLPDEEHLAAGLCQEQIQYALASLPKRPPQWFRSGLSWVAASAEISPTRITFADTIASFKDKAIPSLAALLTKTENFDADDELLAALFVHFGLYGSNGKYAKEFVQFAQQQSGQPFSETAFINAFQKDTAKMERELATYSRTFAAYKSHELNGKLPELPAFTVREATQSEVARLQADALISQNKADQALGIVRIAYWRGEREPAMLAILAGLEERCGSLERARKITQGLMSLPTPPVRVFPVAAKLHLRDATVGKKPEYKLTPDESKLILTPLARAVKATLVTEEVCSLMAEVVLRSSQPQPESITNFLKMVAPKFQNNATIQNAATLATAATSQNL